MPESIDEYIERRTNEICRNRVGKHGRNLVANVLREYIAERPDEKPYSLLTNNKRNTP